MELYEFRIINRDSCQSGTKYPTTIPLRDTARTDKKRTLILIHGSHDSYNNITFVNSLFSL